MDKEFKITYDESIKIDIPNYTQDLKDIIAELEDLYKKGD